MDPVVLTARAFLLAFTAVFLGVVGHVTADGLLPGPAVLVLLLAVASVACLGLLRSPASPLRIVALLVGGQTAIHLVLTVTAGHAGDAASRLSASGLASPPVSGPLILPTVDGRRVGSLQDSYEVASGAHSVVPSLPVGHLIADLQAHAPMMVVHLLAAVGVGLWLAVGERCLWTLVTLLAAVAVGWLPVVLGHLTPVTRTPAARPVVRRTAARLLLLARSVSRRGPPALLAV